MNKEQNTLITIAEPRSPISEAYRTLRTNLDFAGLDRSLKTLVVTSAGVGEGKTTTLANLAVVSAQAGRRVILVDADLRRPTLHQLFGLPNETGLTTMMRDEEVLAAPPLQATGVEGLSVLTSGPLPPNPADLMGSRRMEEVIAALAERADQVLFDTPPVVAVTDAAVLTTKVDGVLLVIGAGKTRRDQARAAVQRLEQVNARLVGAVLTNAEMGATFKGYVYTGP
ncbi:MAG TPA: polysaccharide biosynthesis tyrosine autokinase [Anaerolineae bacterium]|nr:polysaccharide biosynthesis tyrosine autokinase [Anaerolineae bacterium]